MLNYKNTFNLNKIIIIQYINNYKEYKKINHIIEFLKEISNLDPEFD